MSLGCFGRIFVCCVLLFFDVMFASDTGVQKDQQHLVLCSRRI